MLCFDIVNAICIASKYKGTSQSTNTCVSWTQHLWKVHFFIEFLTLDKVSLNVNNDTCLSLSWDYRTNHVTWTSLLMTDSANLPGQIYTHEYFCVALLGTIFSLKMSILTSNLMNFSQSFNDIPLFCPIPHSGIWSSLCFLTSFPVLSPRYTLDTRWAIGCCTVCLMADTHLTMSAARLQAVLLAGQKRAEFGQIVRKMLPRDFSQL